MKTILAVDIGGTYIKYAFMKEELSIEQRGQVATPKESREDLVETIGKIYDLKPEVAGIAISMPGIIDSEKGYCSMGGALHYNSGFYFRESLYQRCPVKIYMENDAKCAAMAEATVGSLRDVEDGFVLIFGTMIGGAIIKGGKLHKGKKFSAGEVSYIITHPDGEPDFETVWGNRCSTLRLCEWFAKEKGLNPSEIDGVLFFEALEKEDEDAKECLIRYTREIAVQIFNLQTILDVERFAIGGGISAQPIFIDYIRKHLEQFYDKCPYPISRTEVVCCELQNDANLIGALQCFLANS